MGIFSKKPQDLPKLDLPSAIKLDPSNSTKEEEVYLQALLQQEANSQKIRHSRVNKKPGISTHKPYKVTIDNQIVEIELTKSLIKTQEDGKLRYYVLDENSLGKGSYGKVKKSAIYYDIIKDNAGKITKMTRGQAPLVEKTQVITAKNTLKDIEREHRVMKDAGIAVGDLVVRKMPNGTEKAYFWMHEIKGETLENYLKSEPAKILTFDQRLELALNLVQAIKEFQEKTNTYNLDLAARNIMYDPKTKKFTIIDAGKAFKIGEKISGQLDFKITPLYLSQKAIIEEAKAGDYVVNFLLAQVIAQIFGGQGKTGWLAAIGLDFNDIKAAYKNGSAIANLLTELGSKNMPDKPLPLDETLSELRKIAQAQPWKNSSKEGKEGFVARHDSPKLAQHRISAPATEENLKPQLAQDENAELYSLYESYNTQCQKYQETLNNNKDIEPHQIIQLGKEIKALQSVCDKYSNTQELQTKIKDLIEDVYKTGLNLKLKVFNEVGNPELKAFFKEQAKQKKLPDRELLKTFLEEVNILLKREDNKDDRRESYNGLVTKYQELDLNFTIFKLDPSTSIPIFDNSLEVNLKNEGEIAGEKVKQEDRITALSGMTGSPKMPTP